MFVRICKSGVLMRKAFTLVELLVVIFIIGLLVALVMPAIQYGREAARRTQCINRQAQLAIGFQSYESAKGVLPGWRDFITVSPPLGGVVPPEHFVAGDEVAAQASWVFSLLPYIEQADLYDRLKTGQVEVGSSDPFKQIQPIGLLHCPSHLEGPRSRATSYIGNTGAVDDFSDKDSHDGWNGVTTDGNVANGPLLDRVKIVASRDFNFVPKAEDCLCNSGSCRYRPNAEKYRNAVARLSDITSMDGTTYTLLTSENIQRGYWISEQIVHFSTDRAGRNSPTVAANHWRRLSDGRWFVNPDSGEHTLEGAVGFCWPRFYAEPNSYILCQIAYPRDVYNVSGNTKQGFTGACNAPEDDNLVFNRGQYDTQRIPVWLNMFPRKTFATGTWYQSARPSSNHATVVVVSFCDGNVRPLSEGINEVVFVQLMTASDARSDAGWQFPAGELDRNFLEGKLFNSGMFGSR